MNVARIAFPAVNYVLNRRHVLDRYRRLMQTESYKEEALKELQFQKLASVLRHAYTYSPYYARKFNEIGCTPDDIKSLDDIQRIPPLTRHDVIAHRLDLVDTRYRHSVTAADRAGLAPGFPVLFARFRRHRLVRNTTTGSTGTPMVFYEDGSTTALNWAHEMRVKHWFGLSLGAREIRMTMLSTEFAGKSRLSSAREFLWNQVTLPGFFLSDREYELCLREIQRFRPRVLWGLTTALTGLARFIQRANADVSSCQPELIISRAAPLYEHERALLSDVFGCRVTNIYGSRELGHIAMICPHRSLHVNQEDFLLEIEGHDVEQKNTGPGELLVTRLNESPMPFIRYRIGDLAELGASECSCGRSLGVLKSVLGRIGEIFTTEDGRVVEPSFWCDVFMVGKQNQDVEKFQVIYRQKDCIRLRIVRRPSFSAGSEADLRRLLAQSFSSSVQFEFEYVSEIKPHRSGKHVMVVNEIVH
jgi:phenylacetate-CoA ligase